LFLGQKVPGIAQATNKAWTDTRWIPADLEKISKVYGNIQANLGSHGYKLDDYTCQTWVNNRLYLKDDGFTK